MLFRSGDRAWNNLSEQGRDRFRQMNEADLAAQHAREIQAQRDQFALAREFQGQIREDEYKWNEELKRRAAEEKARNKRAPFDPDGKKPASDSPVKDSPVKKTGPSAEDQLKPTGLISGQPAADYNAATPAERKVYDGDASGNMQMKKEGVNEMRSKKPTVRTLQKRRRLGTPVKQAYAA